MSLPFPDGTETPCIDLDCVWTSASSAVAYVKKAGLVRFGTWRLPWDLKTFSIHSVHVFLCWAGGE